MRMLPARCSRTTARLSLSEGLASEGLALGVMATLSSSAELAAGVAMNSPTTGMRDARRPKLPTRAKPRNAVVHPPRPYNSLQYNIAYAKRRCEFEFLLGFWFSNSPTPADRKKLQ